MALKLEEKVILSCTRTANAVLTANRFVKADADPANVIVCTANVRVEGIVSAHAHVGDPVKVDKLGLVIVEAGAALLTPGTAVVSDATGRAVAAGATGDQNIAGYTVNTATAAGELITILLFPATKYAGSAGGAAASTLTVGAEVAHPTHTINVAAVLKDYLGNAVALPQSVLCYLSDDALGQTLVTAVLTADAAIGTDGTIIQVVTAKKEWRVVSEANGQFDLTFAKTDGAATMYLNVVMPDGRLVTSGAITFSA
jgi:hypothetical protein